MNQHPMYNQSMITAECKTRYLKLGQIRLEISSLEAKIAWFQSQLAPLKEQEDQMEDSIKRMLDTATPGTESGT